MNDFLDILKKLLTAQNPAGGSMFGLPASFNPAIGNLFDSIQSTQKDKQYNLNTDPTKDIEPYRVNPYKGFATGFRSGGSVQDHLQKVLKNYGLGQYQEGGVSPLPKINEPINVPNNIKTEYNNLYSYISSPLYEQRLSNFYNNPEQIRNDRLSNLNSTDIRIASRLEDPNFLSDNKARGYYNMADKETVFSPTDLHQQEILHEFTHASTLNNRGVNDKERQFIGSLVDTSPENQKVNGLTPEQAKYISNPTEYLARINTLRADLHNVGVTKKFGDPIKDIEGIPAIEILKRYGAKNLGDPNGNDSLFDLIRVTKGKTIDEQLGNILKALNTLANNTPKSQDTIKTAKLGGNINNNTMDYNKGGQIDPQMLQMLASLIPFVMPGRDMKPVGVQDVRKGGQIMHPLLSNNINHLGHGGFFGGSFFKGVNNVLNGIGNVANTVVGMTPVGQAFQMINGVVNGKSQANQKAYDQQYLASYANDPANKGHAPLNFHQWVKQQNNPQGTSTGNSFTPTNANYQQSSLFDPMNTQQAQPSFGLFNGNFNQSPGLFAQNPTNYTYSGAQRPGGDPWNNQGGGSNVLSGLSQLFQGTGPDGSGGIGAGVNPLGNNNQGGAGDMMSLLSSLIGSQGSGQNGLGSLLQGLIGQGKYGGKVKKKKYRAGGFIYDEGGDTMQADPQQDNSQQDPLQQQQSQQGQDIQQQGPPLLIPIQTEKVGDQPEMIVHLDGTITEVNATKRHSKMDDDEVTDIVPQGSYILSADKAMKISWKQADNITIAIKSQPYSELKQGKVPEIIKFSSLWSMSDKGDKTPAQLGQMIKDKYPIIDLDDIFAKQTNQSNLQSRQPYIMNLIRLNDMMKGKTPQQFRKGGQVQKYPLGDWVSLAGSLAPLLGNLFGGGGKNQQPGQVSPLVQNGLLATMPMYQTGINQNIQAQQQALSQGQTDFTALGNKLIGDANASAQGQGFANLTNTGLGAFNALATETNLPRLDLGASRARLSNYRPTAGSQASVAATSTPTYDANSIMRGLGSRSAPMLNQLMSDNQRNSNTAQLQRNQLLDANSQNTIGQLNNLDYTELSYNNAQKEKERQLREGRRQGLVGSLSQGMQRNADINTGRLGQIGDIQSQILPITTQLGLQKAGLQGQNLMLGAQNAFNGFTALGSMQSSNALAKYLQNNPLSALTPGNTNTGNTQGNTGNNNGTGIVPGSSANTSGGTTEQFQQLLQQVPDISKLMQVLQGIQGFH